MTQAAATTTADLVLSPTVATTACREIMTMVPVMAMGVTVPTLTGYQTTVTISMAAVRGVPMLTTRCMTAQAHFGTISWRIAAVVGVAMASGEAQAPRATGLRRVAAVNGVATAIVGMKAHNV
jgi:RIO-like serine/threonine protein kinase